MANKSKKIKMEEQQTKTYEELLEEEREKFEELFPKDIEAKLGIRPSKSNRSAALVLYADFNFIIKQAVKQTEAKTILKAVELLHKKYMKASDLQTLNLIESIQKELLETIGRELIQ